MLLQIKDVAAVATAERAIRELLGVHAEWFLVQDGGAPLALANSEFDFFIARLEVFVSIQRLLGGGNIIQPVVNQREIVIDQ